MMAKRKKKHGKRLTKQPWQGGEKPRLDSLSRLARLGAITFVIHTMNPPDDVMQDLQQAIHTLISGKDCDGCYSVADYWLAHWLKINPMSATETVKYGPKHMVMDATIDEIDFDNL